MSRQGYLVLLMAGVMMLSSCAGYISHSRYGNGWSLNLERHREDTGDFRAARIKANMKKQQLRRTPETITESTDTSNMNAMVKQEEDTIYKCKESVADITEKPVRSVKRNSTNHDVTQRKTINDSREISIKSAVKKRSYHHEGQTGMFVLCTLLLLLVTGIFWLVFTPGLLSTGIIALSVLFGMAFLLGLYVVLDYFEWAGLIGLLIAGLIIACFIWMLSVPSLFWIGISFLGLIFILFFILAYWLIIDPPIVNGFVQKLQSPNTMVNTGLKNVDNNHISKKKIQFTKTSLNQTIKRKQPDSDWLSLVFGVIYLAVIALGIWLLFIPAWVWLGIALLVLFILVPAIFIYYLIRNW